MADSLFAKIIQREISAQILCENDFAMAILDISPLAVGHTLVIPKKEARTILELPDENLAQLFLTVKEITGILDKALSPAGFTIGLNHKVGQGVDYVHVHVIPRYKDDGGGSLHTILQGDVTEELAKTAERINKFL